MSPTTKLGGYDVDTLALRNYVNHILSRYISPAKNLSEDELQALEGERRRLHDAVLASVGLRRDEDSDRAADFEMVLTAYVDSRIEMTGGSL